MTINELFALPIGALLIFLLRVVDVSMATVRLIFAVRGRRGLATIIGFFEIIVWIFAVGQALQHFDSVLHLLGYAAGFAAGNYVGVWLEGRLALGLSVVHAVCRSEEEGDRNTAGQLANAIRLAGYAVTQIQGRGRDGSVELLKIVVPRRRTDTLTELIRDYDPDSFITVEEVRATQGGHMQLAGRKTPVLAFPWLHVNGRASASNSRPGVKMTNSTVAAPSTTPVEPSPVTTPTSS
ncbi:MAG: DUF2179 domain-containing protein [Gemmatimonadales bacterium]